MYYSVRNTRLSDYKFFDNSLIDEIDKQNSS